MSSEQTAHYVSIPSSSSAALAISGKEVHGLKGELIIEKLCWLLRTARAACSQGVLVGRIEPFQSGHGNQGNNFLIDAESEKLHGSGDMIMDTMAAASYLLCADTALHSACKRQLSSSQCLDLARALAVRISSLLDRTKCAGALLALPSDSTGNNTVASVNYEYIDETSGPSNSFTDKNSARDDARKPDRELLHSSLALSNELRKLCDLALTIAGDDLAPSGGDADINGHTHTSFAHSFQHFYLFLLARRLLRGRSHSLRAEKQTLLRLPPMPRALLMLNEMSQSVASRYLCNINGLHYGPNSVLTQY